MKRISFIHTPHSKTKFKRTALFTAAFLLLFANLFAFSLAEDRTGDPDDGVSQSEPGGEAGEPGEPSDETGETGDGTGDGSGEPSEPGGESGEAPGGEETREPGDPDEDVNALESVMLAALAGTPRSANSWATLTDAVSEANGDTAHTYVITLTAGIDMQGPLTIGSGAKVALTGAANRPLNQKGYLISVSGGGTLTLAGAVKIDGAGSNGNGGIENKGTLDITDTAEITGGRGVSVNSISQTVGGGVYNDEGTLTMSGGTITGCSADSGGGVYSSGGAFTLSGGTISGNTATDGDGGGVCVYDTRFDMSRGTIANNRAEGGSGGGAGSGGGVYQGGGDNPDRLFTMSGGTITGNHATAGGGVWSYMFRLSAGGVISENEAGQGGGVYANHMFYMSGGTIRNNTAYDSGPNGGNGGGVYKSGGELRLSGGDITGNHACGGGAFPDNGGGGIYLHSGDLYISGGTISDNETDRNGGGVYAITYCFLSGGTVTSNAAVNGGGIYSQSSVLPTGGAITISKNTASGAGGGIHTYYMDRPDVSLDDASAPFSMVVEGNRAVSGGGVCVYENWFHYDSENAADRLTITGNAAVNGGGVYSESLGRMPAFITVANNTASEDGGGVYAYKNDSPVTINLDGTVEGNRAARNGGGIYNSHLQINGTGRVLDNKAGNDGGGVYMAPLHDGASYVYVSGVVEGNRAERDGGGVHTRGFGIHPEDDSPESPRVANNEAGRDGGGVYGAPSEYGREISGGIVEANRAGRNGGGLYLAPDEQGLQLDGGKIRGNTAGLLGGGLYYGGGMYGDNPAEFFVSGQRYYDTGQAGGSSAFPTLDGALRDSPWLTSFVNNTAAAGGGIYMTTYGGVTFDGRGERIYGEILFSGNRALTGTITPSGSVLGIPWAKHHVAGGTGAFGLFTRETIDSPFTNDDINYFGNVSVLYTDSANKAAGPLPPAEIFTVTENGQSGTHTVAAAQTARDGSPFSGWRLAGNGVLAFFGSDDAPSYLPAGTTLSVGQIFRPLVDAVLNAVWGSNGGGGRPTPPDPPTPPAPDPDPDPEPPTPPPGPTPNPTPEPTPTPAPPAASAPPARSYAPAAVVANTLPPPAPEPAPEPEPEPAPQAEAPAPPAPPAETPAPPSVNAFENFLATTGIAPFGIPLAAPSGSAWAILNLILAVLSVACAAFAILRLLKGRAGDASEGAYGETATAGDPRRAPGFPYTILATIGAFVSLITFILTENVSLAPAWLDRFSPFMLVLCVLCAVFAALAARTTRAAGYAEGTEGETRVG